MGAGHYADARGSTWLLGKPWLPYLWGPMAGAALFGRPVMWRVGTVVLVLVVGAIFSKAVEGTGFASGEGAYRVL